MDAQLSPSEAQRTRKITIQGSDSIFQRLEAATDRPGMRESLVAQAALERFLDRAAYGRFVYAAIDRNEPVLNFCISGGLFSSSTGRGEFSSNRRQRKDTIPQSPWLKKLNWKSQIALKRKSRPKQVSSRRDRERRNGRPGSRSGRGWVNSTLRCLTFLLVAQQARQEPPTD
ncbi:hypothetical protein ACFQX9_30195 [Bradyrhizobium sp. GCM10028915]|uniref:hypothetical protein n=1 Tax=Bradyrhizobium sp. GCM10028915 TaxID=3273385 RepID=UPI003616EA99